MCPFVRKPDEPLTGEGYAYFQAVPLRTGFGSEGAADSRPLYGCVKFEAGGGVVKRHPIGKP